jgi:hypothetical protein
MCTKGHLRCRQAVPQTVQTIVSLTISLSSPTYAIKFEDRQVSFLFGIPLIYHYNSIIEADDVVLVAAISVITIHRIRKFEPQRISTYLETYQPN